MKKITGTIILLAFLLAGCLTVISTESELKISSEEKWAFQMEIKAPQNQVLMYSADLAEQFNAIAQESEREGIEFTWEQGDIDSEGNISLMVTAKGTGYNKWNDWIEYSGSLQPGELLGEPVTRFRLSMSSTSLGQGLTNSFTLVGGKILSTNGTQVNANTVKWVDAGTMEAVMEPPKSNAGLWVIGIIAGTAILFFLLFSKKSNSQKTAFEVPSPTVSSNIDPVQQAGGITEADRVRASDETSIVDEQKTNNRVVSAQAQTENHFCAFCGEPWTQGGKFCTRCGRPGHD